MPVLVLGLITFTARGQNGFIEDFKEKWKNSAAYTIELAAAMPEEHYDFKPTEEEMSFKSQLLHMISNMNWLSTSYLGGTPVDFDLKREDYSKAEILEMLNSGYELSGKAVDMVTPGQLEETVEFFAGPKSKRQIITLMNDHSTHHRGQLIVYLRLNGIKPPRYRGW